MAEAKNQPATEPAPAKDPIPAGPTIVTEGKLILFKPANFQELWGFAQTICTTEMVPLADRNKPGQILAKIQYGSEIGLSPMLALRYIAVLPNGLPTIWGDGAKMLVTSNPLVEVMEETPPHEIMERGYAECTIKRRGWAKPVTRRFTKEMAMTAQLWGGTGDTQEKKEKSVWFKYPWRMLQWRAFHLCVSDSVPEALGGLVPREIATDYDIEITAEPLKDPTPTPKPLGPSVDNPAKAAGEGKFAGPENAPPADAEITSPADKPHAPAQAATLEARLEWLRTAGPAQIEKTGKEEPMLNLKGLTQEESAAFCRALTDRQKELAQEVDRER